MKKLGCASCGGTKKMAKGGTTKSVSISKRGAGVVKETKGDTNQKMGIYGVAQTGPTGPNNSGIATMKKGGMVKKMQDGGTSSTKTNMFGKTKEISKTKSERIGTRFLKKSKNTIEAVDDGNSYTIKPKAKSNRSVTTTFFKTGGTAKSKKK